MGNNFSFPTFRSWFPSDPYPHEFPHIFLFCCICRRSPFQPLAQTPEKLESPLLLARAGEKRKEPKAQICSTDSFPLIEKLLSPLQAFAAVLYVGSFFYEQTVRPSINIEVPLLRTNHRGLERSILIPFSLFGQFSSSCWSLMNGLQLNMCWNSQWQIEYRYSSWIARKFKIKDQWYLAVHYEWLQKTNRFWSGVSIKGEIQAEMSFIWNESIPIPEGLLHCGTWAVKI